MQTFCKRSIVVITGWTWVIHIAIKVSSSHIAEGRAPMVHVNIDICSHFQHII